MKKPKFAQRTCKHHGVTEFVLEGRGSYRCKKCRSQRVSEWRRDKKRKLVDMFGGCCRVCGYDRCVSALHFHHKDPSEKDFGLSGRGMTKSFRSMVKEASKCVLVCGNCHSEIHEGLIDIPV